MIIYHAIVTMRGGSSPGSVDSTLNQQADGWTDAVTGAAGGPFMLPWRSATPEAASPRLQESYRDPVWHVSVLNAGEEEA